MSTSPIPSMNIGMLVWMLVAVVGALLIGGVNYLVQQAKQNAVQTFTECQAYPDSRTLETFPEQCILPNGRTFTQ